MTKFEEFKEVFDSFYSDVDTFMWDEVESNKKLNLMNFKEVADNSVYTHDSYGNEDSILEKIFYFKDYNLYIKFEGTQQSYNGVEWNSMKEVKPAEKTIQIFEEVK